MPVLVICTIYFPLLFLIFAIGGSNIYSPKLDPSINLDKKRYHDKGDIIDNYGLKVYGGAISYSTANNIKLKVHIDGSNIICHVKGFNLSHYFQLIKTGGRCSKRRYTKWVLMFCKEDYQTPKRSPHCIMTVDLRGMNKNDALKAI
ncbi:MAG: hypothetical protein ACOC3V_04460, partial [bacterium]